MTLLDWHQWLAPVPPSAEVAAAFVPGSEVFIYGSGTVAAEVLGLLRGRGVKVRAIIDGNTTRTHVVDLAVLRPDSADISPADRECVPMVIGIFNAFVDMAALRRRLAGQGWRNLIGFIDLHALFLRELGDRYWLTGRDHALAHCEAIARIDALWADDQAAPSIGPSFVTGRPAMMLFFRHRIRPINISPRISRVILPLHCVLWMVAPAPETRLPSLGR